MRRTAIIALVIVMLASCFAMTATAFAKSNKTPCAPLERGGFFCWTEVVKAKNGVWYLERKDAFTVKYQADKKGDYKVDIYKSNKKGMKIKKVKTVTVKAKNRYEYKGKPYYVGYKDVKGMKPNTYYRLYAKQKKTIPSAVGKTNNGK